MTGGADALHAALEQGTADDVVRLLRSDTARQWRAGDRTALAVALTNRSPADRLAIAHLLLDRGADGGYVLEHDRVGALHVLFSHEPHDFAGEAGLTSRLIEAGADPNLVSPRFGSPLAVLAGTFKYADKDLQPLYDALIGSGRLSLSTVDKGGRTMLENVAVKAKFRQSLYDQLLAFAASTGQPHDEGGSSS